MAHVFRTNASGIAGGGNLDDALRQRELRRAQQAAPATTTTTNAAARTNCCAICGKPKRTAAAPPTVRAKPAAAARPEAAPPMPSMVDAVRNSYDPPATAPALFAKTPEQKALAAAEQARATGRAAPLFPTASSPLYSWEREAGR